MNCHFMASNKAKNAISMDNLLYTNKSNHLSKLITFNWIQVVTYGFSMWFLLIVSNNIFTHKSNYFYFLIKYIIFGVFSQWGALFGINSSFFSLLHKITRLGKLYCKRLSDTNPNNWIIYTNFYNLHIQSTIKEQ